MDLIEEFLDEVDVEAKYSGNLKDINAFVSDYPVERILSLTLDEYNHTGYHNTFCYRLEKGLKEYSSMGNTYPHAYGVYIDSNNTCQMSKGLSNQFGNDYEAAFAHTKECIAKLLKAGKEENYRYIKKSEINQQFRFKLLSVYYPDKYFPVCTMPAALGYSKAFGIDILPSDKMMDINIKLAAYKKENLPSKWTLYHAMAFSDWLWRKERMVDKSFNHRRNGKEEAEKIEAELEKLHLFGEEREAVVKQRVNQGVFRDMLMDRDRHCRLCLVGDKRLLIASHIKPWADSAPGERLDPDNGFLMCPNHDKLFDRRLISFDDDGQIMISPELSENDRTDMNVSENMKISLTEGNRKYLEHHRRRFESNNAE